jgi:hypothetical protein
MCVFVYTWLDMLVEGGVVEKVCLLFLSPLLNVGYDAKIMQVF